MTDERYVNVSASDCSTFILCPKVLFMVISVIIGVCICRSVNSPIKCSAFSILESLTENPGAIKSKRFLPCWATSSDWETFGDFRICVSRMGEVIGAHYYSKIYIFYDIRDYG